MAAPTKAANVKKVLANSEPSTHDPSATMSVKATGSNPKQAKVYSG
jgi:hypothetical protein